MLGKFHGFVYQPGSNNYRPDTTNLTAFTRAQLKTKILSGDTLTILGVTPGAGTRMGIQRKAGGPLDADAPRPALGIARVGTSTVISWATNANSFVLEAAGTLSTSNWTTETSPRGIMGSQFNVTNPPAGTNRFFRLRDL